MTANEAFGLILSSARAHSHRMELATFNMTFSYRSDLILNVLSKLPMLASAKPLSSTYPINFPRLCSLRTFIFPTSMNFNLFSMFKFFGRLRQFHLRITAPSSVVCSHCIPTGAVECSSQCSIPAMTKHKIGNWILNERRMRLPVSGGWQKQASEWKPVSTSRTSKTNIIVAKREFSKQINNLEKWHDSSFYREFLRQISTRVRNNYRSLKSLSKQT